MDSLNIPDTTAARDVADVDPHDGGKLFGLDLVVGNHNALHNCWKWPKLKAADLSHPDKIKEAKQSKSNSSKSSARNRKQIFIEIYQQQQYGRERTTALPMGRIGLALYQSASKIQQGHHRIPLGDSWPFVAALFGSTTWSTSGGDYLMVRGPVGACGSGFEFRRTIDAPCSAGNYDGGNLIGTDDVLVGDEVVSIGNVSAIGLGPATAESLVEKFLLHPVEQTFSDASNLDHGGDRKQSVVGGPSHAFRVLLRRRQPQWNEWWQQVCRCCVLSMRSVCDVCLARYL